MKLNSDFTKAEKPLSWLNLIQKETGPVFFSAWLSLLNDGCGGLDEAVLVLGPENQGPFLPVATLPHKTPCSLALMRLCEQVIDYRRPLASQQNQVIYLVIPVIQGDNLYGVLGVARRGPGFSPPQKNWLHWGVGWLIVQQLLDQNPNDSELNERLLLLLDLLLSALGGQSPREANQAMLSQAQVVLGCDRISLGFSHRSSIRVYDVSSTGEFSRRTDLIQSLESAMNEAADQGQILHFPADKDSLDTLIDHKKLSVEHGNKRILTVPFFLDQQTYGALTFEWQTDPNNENLSLAESIATVMGRVLLEKKLSDLTFSSYVLRKCSHLLRRLFGPRYLGTKLIFSCLIATTIFFSIYQTEFRISADSRLEGALHRTIGAPFDGYVENAFYRAGQTVAANTVLAILDNSELQLELARWQSQVAQHEREMRLSQARGDSAQARVAAAQAQQSKAQLALTEQMLARTQITAPFDALITLGDLSQDLGLPVSKGQQLFELSPIDDFRVVLEVAEGDIAHIREGQQGRLVLKAFPDNHFPIEVTVVTPVAEARDGKNLFRVEAQLKESSSLMRPGMEGIAKVDIDSRHLIWIWTRNAQNWVRLQLWKWLGV